MGCGIYFNWILSFVLVVAAMSTETRFPYHLKSKEIISKTGLKPEDLFGYSVAYQKDKNRLIIGSPKAGKVFTCSLKPSTCTNVKLPITRDDLSDSWLGATVNAGPGFFMACGPRFVEKGAVHTGGQCYYQESYNLDKGLNLKHMTNVDVSLKKTYHTLAYGEDIKYAVNENMSDSFGWSSHVGGSKNNILVGGPAMSIGRTMVYSKVNGSPKLIEIKNEELEHKVSHNFGYSITSGNFFQRDEDDDSTYYAISTPYGTFGKGRVMLFSEGFLLINDDVTDDDVGTLFGAAQCSLKAEGRSALLVGAPAYFKGHFYDVGAVFIFTFENDKATLRRQLKGYQSGGYYGNAIVTIGDFDHDNIDEVAISAPYENGNRGAVYIYSGKQLLSKDPDVKWLQRIEPEGGKDQYFGLSLSSLADSDENGCNELAIGTPGDNSVTLLSCLASVDVHFHAKFPDLKEQSKKLLRDLSTSFTFELCLNVIYSEKPQLISSEISVAIHIEHKEAEIVNADTSGTFTFLAELRTLQPAYCKLLNVTLPEYGNYDFDITFNMSASLLKNPLEQTIFDPKLVLINNKTYLSEQFTAPPLPGSKLSYEVSTTLYNDYVIGSSDNETLTLTMKNGGRTAGNACMRVRITGVKPAQYPVKMCSLVGTILTCKPAPALKRGESRTMSVSLAAKELTSLTDKVVIQAEVMTQCSKRVGEPYNRTIQLKTDNNIVMRGLSLPISVNMSKVELASDKGKHIEHTYALINLGVTKWVKIMFEMTVPPEITRFVSVGSNDCSINNNKTICYIPELKKNVPVNIKVLIDIGPGSPIIDEIKKKENVPVETSINVTLGNTTIHGSIITMITLSEGPKVPLWIYIVSALVGILILLLLGWILYECGFLRRKHKEELVDLQKDVNRQSMRRSKVLRESTIEVLRDEQKPGDHERLVDVPEEIYDDTCYESQERDPERVAFAAELAKALNKDNKVPTKVQKDLLQ